MAQAGYTPLLIYGSTTATNVPLAANLTTSLSGVELAINAADGKLFYKDSGGVVQVLATKGSAVIGGSNTQVQYNSSGSLAGSANLTFDGTTLTAAGFSGPFNGTVGATTPNTGSFTTLTTSSTVTLSGGTANGVGYLNGSKVLTTGSALQFDGTSLGLGRSAAFLSGAGIEVYRNGVATLRLSNITSGQENQVELSTETNGPFRFNSLNSKDFAWAFSSSEQMRLTTTGLGIGTSSPSYKLDVAGQIRAVSSTFGLSDIIAQTTAATGTGYSRFILKTADREWRIINDASTSGSPLLIYDATAAAMRLTLDSSGNLGLGVTPSAWATVTAMQIKGASVGGTSSQGFFSTGAYFNAGWKYTGTGIPAYQYAQDGGVHAWFTAPSGTAGNAITFTQAMTLDASGRLQIGRTSASGGEALGVTTSNALVIDMDSTAANGGYMRYTASGTIYGYIGTATGITGAGGTNALALRSENALVFASGGATERARIDSSGNLLVGTTSQVAGATTRATIQYDDADYILTIANTNASQPYGQRIVYTAASPNDISKVFLYCTDSTAQRAAFRSNGGLANYSANDVNLSDRREKINIAPAKSYLETICAIPVQTFNYIDQNLEDDPGLTLGVVAQDVQAVAPELVSESNWGTEDEPKQRLSIYQTDLQYALMKCIQELKAEVDSLKAQLKGN